MRPEDEGNPDTKDVTPEEAVERPWASNDKAMFDTLLKSLGELMSLGNNNISSLLNLQSKLNDAYATHVTDMNSQRVENNRFTLDRLYGVFPEEAAGIGTMLKFVSQLLDMGWQPPK